VLFLRIIFTSFNMKYTSYAINKDFPIFRSSGGICLLWYRSMVEEKDWLLIFSTPPLRGRWWPPLLLDFDWDDDDLCWVESKVHIILGFLSRTGEEDWGRR
jgi:hypothetical protein